MKDNQELTSKELDNQKESLFKLLGRVSGGDVRALKEAAILFAGQEKQLTATQQKLDVAVEALEELLNVFPSDYAELTYAKGAIKLAEAALNTIGK